MKTGTQTEPDFKYVMVQATAIRDARMRKTGFVKTGYAAGLMVSALTGCQTIKAKILKSDNKTFF